MFAGALYFVNAVTFVYAAFVSLWEMERRLYEGS